MNEAQRDERIIRIHESLQEVAPHIPADELEAAAITLAQLDLDEFHALWAQRKDDFPDHLPPVESRIISLALDRALADEGIEIAVDWDVLGSCDKDPENGLPWTRDRSQVELKTAATSYTFYRFRRRGEEKRLGWLFLVHGNLTDVICDHADNEWTRTLMGPVNELADRINEGGMV